MITHCADETRAAGQELALQLRPGDIVFLEGPLGSGKTTFVQGIAEGLGAGQPATSPSFVIVNEYPLSGLGPGASGKVGAAERRGPKPQPPGPIVLRHVDLYRLSDPTLDADRIGLSELLSDPTAVTVIEWADRLPRELLSGIRMVRRVRLAHGRRESERTMDIL